jgi:hypothetical protein
MIKA